MLKTRMSRWVLVQAVVAALGGLATAMANGPRPGEDRFKTPTAITNVKIVTSAGSIIESGTIVMSEGRFVGVGGEVAIPPHAERIDGTGLIAYPGFIDALVHLGIAETERTNAERERREDLNPDPREGPLAATRFANRRGISPEIRAIERYVADTKALEAHRFAGFVTALIAPREGILAGTSVLMNLSGKPVRRSVLAADVAMHGSFRTGENGGYPESLLGVFAQFRQVLLDARWHAKLQKHGARHPSTAARVPTDAALDALQPLLGRKQRIIFEANSEREIRRALSLTSEFGLDVAISGAKEAWKVRDLIKERRIPLIVSLKFDEEPEYGKKKKKTDVKKPRQQDAGAVEDSSTTRDAGEEQEKGQAETEKEEKKKKEKQVYEPLKLRKERRRLWEEQVANIIRLHEAEVPFSLTTRGLKSPKVFLKNLRMVIERGLPEEAAVTALTATPAKLGGMQHQLGAIARGHVANLTLLTKPLAEEKAKTKFVFIDGEKFEPEDEEKKKKNDDSPDEPTEAESDQPNGSSDETANATDDQGGDAATEDEEAAEEPDKGPRFAVEIKADRFPTTQTGGNVLVRGATVIPVTSPSMQRASILILDGKIAAVGSDITPPEGVTVIDAAGRFVIPGLVDAHSHLALDAVNEAALSVSAEVRVGDVIDPTSVGIFRAAAGGATTHHAMHGSANPIGGQNVIMKLKYGRPASELVVADAPPTIKFALGENVKQSNWEKEWGKRFPNTRMGVETSIRAALERAKAYQNEWDQYERSARTGADAPPPRRDLRLEALARVLAGELTVHAHCYRSDEILRLLGVAEEYGFRIGTLQHVLEGYRIAPEIARHGAGASTFSNFWAYKIEAYGAIPHNAALMTEHGITASVNSDSPNTIRYLVQEAAKSIRWGGLDTNRALRLVTLNPARQLQMEDRVGSIEVGKDGDLAIFNGHPLNTFSKCVMTLIDGEVYFEDARPEPTEPCDTLHVVLDADRTIPETPHRAFAIVGATVHPISGPVIENGTVVILQDKIHAIGADVPVPPGAGVIDGAGLHVFPGLIDAGSVLGLGEIGALRATNDQREIGTFNPNLRAASAVHPHSAHIQIARTGGITTALATPSGGRISGQSAVIHLDGWTVDEMLVKSTYALHMSVPSLPVHIPEKKKKQRTKEHKKTLRALEEYLTRAKHYAKVGELAATDPHISFEVDLTLEAMIPYVRGEKPVVLSANAYKEILDCAEFAEKHKLQWVLSGGREAWKCAEFLAEKNVPVILGSPLTYPRGKFEPWDSVYRCAGVLDRAGVRFCFASGSASGAYNLGTQVGMAVAHGLPRGRAERAVTLGAAEILGIADRYGSIEVGKQADLIVTTDTPLQTASLITHMFIDGRPIELTSLHTKNYEKFKNRPAPNLPPPPDLRGPKSLTGR